MDTIYALILILPNPAILEGFESYVLDTNQTYEDCEKGRKELMPHLREMEFLVCDELKE